MTTRREEKIFKAYEGVGKLSNLYDGMMTASTLTGRFALKFFWGLSVEEYLNFLNQAFAGVPKNFCGKLLEVPVGTGVLSLPKTRRFIPTAKAGGFHGAKFFLSNINLSFKI